LNRPVAGLLIKRYVFQHLVIASFTGLMVLASPIAAAGGLNMLSQRPEAPNFELQDIGGQPHLLSLYSGQVVLLNFWATWCKPCEDEMPAMDRLYRALQPEGFEMLAVSVDEETALVERFQERLGVSFPILLDPAQDVSRRYQTTGFPESLLIDKNGMIVERYIGPRDWDHTIYAERIRKLLKER